MFLFYFSLLSNMGDGIEKQFQIFTDLQIARYPSPKCDILMYVSLNIINFKNQKQCRS